MREALLRALELPNPYARGGCARALIRFDAGRDRTLVQALLRVVDDNRRVVMYSDTEGEFLAGPHDRPSRPVSGVATQWPAVDASVRLDVARALLEWDSSLRGRVMAAVEGLESEFGYDPDIHRMVRSFLSGL